MSGKDMGRPGKSNAPKIVYKPRKQGARPFSGYARGKPDDRKKPGLLDFTIQLIYKNLYILGITLMRRKLRLSRILKRRVALLRGKTYARLSRWGAGIAGVLRRFIRRLKAPFLKVGNVRAQMAPVIQNHKKNGKIPLSAYLKIVSTFFGLVSAISRTLINHALPVAAALFLISTINSRIERPVGLEVWYEGQMIGFIQTEDMFGSAVEILQERFISEDAGIRISSPNMILGEPQSEDDFITDKELANRIVMASGEDIQWGYGLYIDNRFYGAVKQSEPIVDELEQIREENRVGYKDEEIQFMKSIRLEDGLYPTSSIVPQRELDSVIHSYETVDEIYIVEQGDSPSLIATKTGVPYDVVLSLNPGIEESLMPGDEILLSKAQPFLSVKNIYTAVYVEEVSYDIEEIETNVYVRGYREPSVKGVPGTQEVTAAVSAVNGVIINREVLSTRMLTPPVTEKIIVGTNDPRTITAASPSGGSAPTLSSQGWLWPTSGGVITVNLGGYPGHTGVDIPRPAGTPIYASAAGTVVVAKTGYTGYGHYIIIDHHNGYLTYYAHASQLYVSVGQSVNQGDLIAGVGRTGNATGNHLHFEVRYNGKVMNPRNYIG